MSFQTNRWKNSYINPGIYLNKSQHTFICQGCFQPIRLHDSYETLNFSELNKDEDESMLQ